MIIMCLIYLSLVIDATEKESLNLEVRWGDYEDYLEEGFRRYE